MRIPTVNNMTSPSSGREVANQYEIDDGRYVVFQSYRTIIAVYDRNGGKTTLDKHWRSSVTTSKYRNQFLGETRQETERKVKSGEYKVRDLNR